MRIALFSGNYNYLREGANQALNRLVGYLEDVGGHQVRIYSPVTRKPDFAPTGTLVPVPSIRLPIRGEFQLALGLPGKIRIDLESFAPDIIHVATPDLLCTRAQTVGLEAGIPVVASLHTLFETYLEYYRLGWARPILEAHLRRFYRRATHVLAPTPALVEELKVLRNDDNVSVWSRGIDRSLFHPARRDPAWRRSIGIADGEVALLFFGRLVLEKGAAVFADTVRALQQRGLPVRPLIVGAGPAAGVFGALRDSVLMGHLEGVALARAVASADVMVTPSTTETFGNVVLEAMASGVPVVSADAPSARALIEDGVSGYLCGSRNIDQFTSAVARLATQPDVRAAVGAAAARASTAFSWEAASASVDEAYRILLQRSARTEWSPIAEPQVA